MPSRLTALLIPVFLIVLAGEAAEPSPPVAWQVELLGRETLQDSLRARWRHAILLREQRGIGLTFSRVEESRWSVSGASTGQVKSHAVVIRLDPYGEVRMTVEDDLAFQEGSVIAGQAERLLIGKDDQGREVSVLVVIPLRGGPLAVPQSPTSTPGPPTTVRSEPSRIPIRQGAAAGLVVPALINGRYDATLLLDTGATHTILSPRTLGEIGVPIPADAPKISVIVAGGQRREGVLVRLESLALGDARLSPLDVLAFDVAPESPTLDGVVGLDFLNHFTVTIDQSAGNVLIAPRSRGLSE